MSAYLVFLIVVPIAAFLFARRYAPRRLFAVSGAAFGMVVSPWATGLYAFYFLGPWGIAPGMVGLALTLLHGPPGFHVARHLGLIAPGVVSDLGSEIPIELLNGVIWGAVYGLVGLTIDTVRMKRARS